MNLYIQVVIYNKKMTESMTLLSLNNQSITKCGDVDIILNIQDNSIETRMDTNLISKLNIEYNVRFVHTPENNSLREIYNKAIDDLKSEDVLLLLDDDTTLPSNYISSLLSYVNNYKENVLFVPKVMVSDKIYSPYVAHSFVSKAIKDIFPGKIKSKNHAFINSGLAIRGKFFIETNFRYPKEVEFYGTDTVFSHAFRKNEVTYILMNLTIVHDVNNHPSNNDANNYANALMKVITFWLGQLHGFSKGIYILYMFFYMLKMTVKFRDVVFLKKFMGLI